MFVRSALLGIPLLLGVAVDSLLAQSYGRSDVDTLRFHELTRTEMTLSTPQGPMPVTSEHEATIGLMLLPGDKATAWYEALRLEMTTPSGSTALQTDAALRKAFRLTVDARGRVAVLEAPTFPASFESVTDLSHQFDDFFLRLPAEPLRMGLAWTDTLVRTDSSGGKSAQWHTVGTFQVERDTIVAGEAAFVISSRQQLRSETSGPVSGQAMRAQSTLEGSDEGHFVYAPKSDRLLARHRTGNLRGTLTMTAAAGSQSMAQSYRYTHRLDAIR